MDASAAAARMMFLSGSLFALREMPTFGLVMFAVAIAQLSRTE